MLPDINSLKAICKAISVLDAILSPEWEFRYYSYNANWGEGEECMQMRNGQGDEMHVLFTDGGAAINGFTHKCTQPPKEVITAQLPIVFSEFVFGEPVKSIGTTFLLWKTGDEGWQKGKNDFEDNSEEMLKIFNGRPQTYLDWATDYFEPNIVNGLPITTITKIYNCETLTNEMVLSLTDSFEDWQQLVTDLEEISYPHKLSISNSAVKKIWWQFWK